jgi:hypothetical protein
VPPANHNTEKEDSDRAFRERDSQNANALADCFPHYGFGIARWFHRGELFANAVGDSYGCAGDVTDEKELVGLVSIC